MTRHEKCERVADKLRRTGDAIATLIGCTENVRVTFGPPPRVKSRVTKEKERQHWFTVGEDWLETVGEPGIAAAVWRRPTSKLVSDELVLAADPILFVDPCTNWRAWQVEVAHRDRSSWKFSLIHFALVEYQGVWVLTPRWEDSLALAQQQFTDALVGSGETLNEVVATYLRDCK